MGYLKYARPVIIAALVIWLLFIIHPFYKEGVIITDVTSPASLMLRAGDIITAINGNSITNLDDFHNALSQIHPNDTVKVNFLRETFPYNYVNLSYTYIASEKNNKTDIGISAKETSFSNLKLSYKLVGGNKFIISSNQSNAINVIKERLKLNNIYDFGIYKENGKIVLLTSAGDEVIPIIETKGQFVAKIGNETFFTPSDIKSICTTGVNCNLFMYQHYNESAPTERNIVWKYGFETDISKEAGQRFVNLTNGLSIASCKYDKCILNETIDYYLDNNKIGSETIYASSKGLPYEKVTIGGDVKTKEDAAKLLHLSQSILKSGPLDAKVESVEKYTPKSSFILSSFVYILIGLVILAGAISFVFLKKIKVALFAVILGASEMLIVIGTLAGVNVIITPGVIISIILSGVIMTLFYSYVSYIFKKEGIITSKILGISKKITNWEIIGIVILTVLIMFIPSLVAPIAVYVAVNLTLTKAMFFKEIEKSK